MCIQLHLSHFQANSHVPDISLYYHNGTKCSSYIHTYISVHVCLQTQAPTCWYIRTYVYVNVELARTSDLAFVARPE